MRNEARIDTVIQYIESVWRKHPDMRFGQLIVNMAMCSDKYETSEDLDRILWNIEEAEVLDLLDILVDYMDNEK